MLQSNEITGVRTAEAFLALAVQNRSIEIEKFVGAITEKADPRRQRAAFHLVQALLKAWAARPVEDNAAAETVEACAKICDLMGWTPGEF